MSENKSLCERIENRIGTYDNASIRAILKREIEWALDEQKKEFELVSKIPFSIELYLKMGLDYEVVTRSGLKVRVLTVYSNPKSDFPVVAFVYSDEAGVPYSFTRFGTYCKDKDSALDLYIRHK